MLENTLSGALAAYLEGAYEAMLRGAKPEDVVRQGLQSAPYGAVGTVATQLDDLPVPGRNTVFGGVPGPTGPAKRGAGSAARPRGEAAPAAAPEKAAPSANQPPMAASDAGGVDEVIRQNGLDDFVRETGQNPEIVANYLMSIDNKRIPAFLKTAILNQNKGKRGSALSQLHVDEIREMLESLGFNALYGGRLAERMTKTLGGIKDKRFQDLEVGTPSSRPKAALGVQTGEQGADGLPIPREQDALNDLEQFGNVPRPYFIDNTHTRRR